MQLQGLQELFLTTADIWTALDTMYIAFLPITVQKKDYN